MTTRMFLFGVLLLFFGVQLRSFESFVLNEQITSVINKRIAAKQVAQPVDPLQAAWQPFDAEPAAAVELPAKRTLRPPRWLGYSLISMGAVLVCACPLCRKG